MGVSVFQEIVGAKGHLIDSDILTNVFDTVIACQCTYEVLEFAIGKTNDEVSQIKLRITAHNEKQLEQVIGDLMLLGCYRLEEKEVVLKTAAKDGAVPDDFYSTTNQKTAIFFKGQWLSVNNQRMDAIICLNNNSATCVKLRDIRKGDLIVCGHQGVRVTPEFKERDRFGFSFMSNDISSERRVETAAAKIAAMMQEIKAQNGKIAMVAGPVVVHTGGVPFLSKLIKLGFVQALLTGNALAVHDIENSFYGTSLGVDLEKGLPIYEGHKNHMRAINTIRNAGSIKDAVASGILKSGIMYECIKNNVPFILAGSIRDDGPLPETIMDLVKAQDQYANLLAGVNIVICLSSMLHSIAVGNMLPAWVKTVCVDINPAVVTKLADRGSSQAVGIVTDVGLFLDLLSRKLSP
jgi:lysine-ketoglutarate reductase/saccharopine dehydrogenase-like protein (TIGR00300 family)